MDCCIGSIEEDDMEVLENSGPVEGMKRNRNCTDKGFIFGMAAFFLILFGFLGFCIANGDLDRIIYGYDDCGNVCGKNNIKTDSTSSFECYGKNMENKKYLLYQSTSRYQSNSGIEFAYKSDEIKKICVENCEAHDAYVDFFNRCYPNSSKKQIMTDNNVLQQIFEDFQICWRSIVLLSFFAFVFSIIMMVLMRFATAFLVWFILASIALASIGLTAYLWVLFNNNLTKMDDDDTDNLIHLAIMSTVFTFVFLLILIAMAKRIKLVIQLFKEAAKVIAAVPLLLLQPVLTFMVICFILFMYIYMTMWITSSGNLENTWDGKVDYILSTFEIFTTWYNAVAFLWIVQFVIGCQNIIIAGSVATWYFARNKENLGTPIITSTLNLVQYHLGTVAVGSLIITIIQIIRLIISYLRAAARRSRIFYLFMCLCSHVIQIIEDFIKYFTRNSYIMTAVYGSPFCVSGRRAVNLLVKNIFSVVAINSVGDYILFFIKLFVAIFTVCVGTEVFRQYDELNTLWFPLTCVGIISYLIAHCFVTVFEMAVDTIFLCFCEDCEENDGYSKPYYMSRNLMEFIENANNKKWTELQQEAWKNGPKRIMLQEAS